MELKEKIRNLVEIALSIENKHYEIILSHLPKYQAQIIETQIGVDLTGVERILDTYGIKHTIKEHGSEKTELLRGQLPINIDDFELIPKIIQTENVKYSGKNSLKQDVFVFERRIGNLYFIVEAVRFSKKGNKLVFQTLFKRK